jgi:hypothetical protein
MLAEEMCAEVIDEYSIHASLQSVVGRWCDISKALVHPA